MISELFLEIRPHTVSLVNSTNNKKKYPDLTNSKFKIQILPILKSLFKTAPLKPNTTLKKLIQVYQQISDTPIIQFLFQSLNFINENSIYRLAV